MSINTKKSKVKINKKNLGVKENREYRQSNSNFHDEITHVGDKYKYSSSGKLVPLTHQTNRLTGCHQISL